MNQHEVKIQRHGGLEFDAITSKWKCIDCGEVFVEFPHVCKVRMEPAARKRVPSRP